MSVFGTDRYNHKGLVGSATGYPRLPRGKRKRLYAYLCPFVGAQQAHIMRDWRPTKIVLWLEHEIKG